MSYRDLGWKLCTSSVDNFDTYFQGSCSLFIPYELSSLAVIKYIYIHILLQGREQGTKSVSRVADDVVTSTQKNQAEDAPGGDMQVTI